jgi:hypothetical protein
MVKRRIVLRNVQNVDFSKTALIELPLGPRYHSVNIQAYYTSGTNTLAGAYAHFSAIRVNVNGRTVREYKSLAAGSHTLFDYSSLMGSYGGTGVPNTTAGASVPIYFAEPWRKSVIDQDSLAWPSAYFSSFSIEVDIPASISSSAGIKLVAQCVVDDFVPKQPSFLVKATHLSVANGGTAFDVVLNKLRRTDYLQQITAYPDSGTSAALTGATLRLGGLTLHELSMTANVSLLTSYGMTPAASGRTSGIYDLVLDHDDLLGSALPLSNIDDLSLNLTSGGSPSGTTVLVIHTYGLP